LSILSILSESLLYGASAKNEPQMNADERRFIVPGLYLNRRRTGSLRAQGVGLSQWRHSFSKVPYFDSGMVQVGGLYGGCADVLDSMILIHFINVW
jgi:hypothetical protein